MILLHYYGELGFNYNYNCIYYDILPGNEIHACVITKSVVDVLFYRELYCDDSPHVAQLENKLRVFL